MQNHILDYLDNIVTTKADKTAYSDGTESLTFGEVYRQSRSIGTYLHKNGIYKRPIVVFMKKAPREIAAFFGVIAGGCFYVPIDEEMPAGRIQMILDNVKTPLVICDETTIAAAGAFSVGEGKPVLYDELVKEQADDAALELIHSKALDTDPIYIVFTSGSTGVPKGVVTSHRSVIDYIEQLSEILGFDETTVFGNQTPLYVDACLKEIYPTIKFGATAYLIPKRYFSMPTELVAFLNQYQINTICWVVSALTMISAFGTFETVVPQYLRTVAFGSEVFPIKQFRRWREALPEATFTNLYGPTEATGMCCYFRVDRELADDEPIPIGKSFPNREILMLGENGLPVKDGEEGEICVRGSSLALGYYNDPSRTADAFVQNPLNSAYPERIYKTGDIGRKNERGELIFVSRKDYQIKHMGHRIELGEIEINASMVPGVCMSACIYDKTSSKIVLYYVGDIAEGELVKELKTRVPRYMLPNRTIRIESMPLTSNGKTDRKALLESYQKK